MADNDKNPGEWGLLSAGSALQEAVGEGFELRYAEEEAGSEVDATHHRTGDGEGAESGQEVPGQKVGEEEPANLPADDAQHGAGSNDTQQSGDEVAGGHGTEQMTQVEEVEEEERGLELAKE